MKAITVYQTQDGSLHYTEEKAKRHAESVFGEKLSSLAHGALRADKYSSMLAYISDNLPSFVDLAKLRDDITLDSAE